MSRAQQTLGNQAVSRLMARAGLQAKLRVSQPGDVYEQEADRIADQIMRMSGPAKQAPCAACAAGKTGCAQCDAEPIGVLRRRAAVPDAVETPANFGTALGSGRPLDHQSRRFFEPRFGVELGQVRIHTDHRAAQSAQAVNALAFTIGRDIVFGQGQYAPATEPGKRLLAHELAHVMQQADPSVGIGLYRLSPAMCAFGADCTPPDAAGAGAATSWKVTLAVDREEEGLGRLVSGNVGHTWVKLRNNAGERYSYGFWPQTGFDPRHPFTSVPGCVHHPDTAHEPPHATDYLDIDYSVSAANYGKALTHAQGVCAGAPDYNLVSYNCTTFAIDVVKAAGVSPPSSTTLAVHNPNALYEGIEHERKKRGKAGSGSKGSKKSP